MKKLIRNMVIAATLLGAFIIPAKALTISSTISSTTANTTQALLLFPNESLTYTLTGTATGQVIIEKSHNNSEWSTTGVSVTGAGSVSSTGKLYSGSANTYYHFKRSTMTAGSLTVILADNDDLVQEFKNNKSQQVVAFYDDSVVVTGGFSAQSSTFTLASLTNPTLTGAITVPAGSTITFSGTRIEGTTTNVSTITFTGAGLNGTKTDNSTSTYTGTNTFNGISDFNSTTTIKGTLTSDLAAIGDIGESTVSVQTTSMNTAATDTFFDGSSVTLTAGDWDMTGLCHYIQNSASFTSFLVQCGIGTASGTGTTGLTAGDTNAQYSVSISTHVTQFTASLPTRRFSIAATTTYFLKMYIGTFTSGQPQYRARLSARRAR